MKRIIQTSGAPTAIGPYSQAVEVNGTLYISGQIAIKPDIGKIIESEIKGQTRQVFENIKAILHDAGYDFADVVKTTCLLSDIDNFQYMNEIMAEYFTENKPARATYAVKDLPLGALVEIETIAVK